MWPLNLSSPNRKQTDIVLCTMNSQRQDSWTSIKKWLCYSGHRVALVVHRAQKSVPDSAGEWPTFLPPPLESCSGTANADGPKLIRTEGLYVKTTIIYQLKRLCIPDCAYTENMFINSVHISLYDISLTQNILYQIKPDVAVWKRLGCPQRNQRTWW